MSLTLLFFLKGLLGILTLGIFASKSLDQDLSVGDGFSSPSSMTSTSSVFVGEVGASSPCSSFLSSSFSVVSSCFLSWSREKKNTRDKIFIYKFSSQLTSILSIAIFLRNESFSKILLSPCAPWTCSC